MTCCVPYCKSGREKKLGVSFHEFPANETCLQALLKVISRKDFVPNENSNNSLVCSLHFVDSDYSCSTSRRRLRPNTVPSVFDGYPRYMQPSPTKKRHKIVRHLLIPHKKTVKPTFPKEGNKKNVAHDFHNMDFSTSVTSTTILSNHPSTTTRLSPGSSDTTHQAVVSVEAAVQAHSRMPPNPSNTRAVNRMRAQTSRNNKAIQKLQEENEQLKKKLEMFEYISQCIERGKSISLEGTVQHFVTD
uniref:THAP-type domain-containing protein n=1 Tax=Rhipicephalus microplus TaxID=6941 RepID=A0A6M2D0F6_RHIMP